MTEIALNGFLLPRLGILIGQVAERSARHFNARRIERIQIAENNTITQFQAASVQSHSIRC